mgnify:CR=1 FL=1
MRRLRLGYILDDIEQEQVVYDFLRQSAAAMHYSVELLIVQRPSAPASDREPATPPGAASGHPRRSRLERAVVRWIERTETAIALRDPTLANWLQRHAVATLDIEKRYVAVTPSVNADTRTYADTDLHAIRSHHLDLLIHGGSGRLAADVLSCARLGAVALCYPTERCHDDRPAGFWEVYRRVPSTGFGLRRLSPDDGNDELLFRGEAATARRWIPNRLRQKLKAFSLLHLALDQIAATGQLPPVLPMGTRDRASIPLPSLAHQCGYLAKIAHGHLRHRWHRLTRSSTRWGVAYQFVPDWRDANLRECVEIANPPNHFLADPFVIRHEGRHVCYVEDYDYGRGKGTISAYQIERDGYTPLGNALDERFHLSYPFLFRDGGELYMCPETHEAKEIRLYKCTGFPLQWRLHRVLMNGVDATDTNIFKWNDRWWLLTNIESCRLGDHSSELYLFHSDRCDSTQWTPHPQNPVLFDSRRARNGGLLFGNDAIYRVFQSHGFDRYGAAMGIARITELNPSCYREEILWTIPPTFRPDIEGTHTYSYADGLLAVDFLRRQRNPR